MIPKILSFVCKNYEVVKKKRTAVSKICGSKVSDGDATTLFDEVARGTVSF